MPHGDVETYYEDGQWNNRVEGSSLAPTSHETKGGAYAAGRQMASHRRVEHIIRNMDGTIGERNSYGHDPRNIPG